RFGGLLSRRQLDVPQRLTAADRGHLLLQPGEGVAVFLAAAEIGLAGGGIRAADRSPLAELKIPGLGLAEDDARRRLPPRRLARGRGRRRKQQARQEQAEGEASHQR